LRTRCAGVRCPPTLPATTNVRQAALDNWPETTDRITARGASASIQCRCDPTHIHADTTTTTTASTLTLHTLHHHHTTSSRESTTILFLQQQTLPPTAATAAAARTDNLHPRCTDRPGRPRSRLPMSTRCPGKCIRPSDHTACGGARRRFLLTRVGLACVNTVFQLIWTRSFSLLRFAGAGQYRRWMRRWFILKPAELTYHESSSNKGEIKGAINLSAWQLMHAIRSAVSHSLLRGSGSIFHH
jgi:hypothetical protein